MRTNERGGGAGRRKILHVITTLEPAGAQTQLLELVRRLDPERFEVVIAHLHRSKHSGVLASDDFGSASIRIVDLSRGGRFDPLVLPRLRALIRRERIDLVHTHLVHAGIVGKLAAAAERRPVVTTRHYASEGKSRRWSYRWEDRLTRRAERVIAVSEAVRRHLVEHEITSEARIRVIPNAIDLDRFDPARIAAGSRGPANSAASAEPADPAAPRERVIGTVGRLSPQKGHDVLLRAFAALRATHRVRLEIVGQGALAVPLAALARELGIADAVRFRRSIPPAAIPQLLAGWDLFAFPSRWEAFGLALLEAMAMERPVVASGVEGVLELVTPGVTGLLVPPGDVPAWTNALRELLEDPARARDMGRRARASIASRYEIGDAARALADLYEELLAERLRTAP